MSTDVPLLNDYKRTFVRNRLLQTFTGGLRLTGCPWYGVVGQIGLFVIPGVVISVFYLYRDWEHSGWGRTTAYVLCGVVAFLYGTILQSLAHIIEKRAEAARENVVAEVDNLGQVQPSRPKIDFMEDEDRIALDGFCGLATWKFLIPKKKYRFNVFFHPLVGGLTSGLGLYFLRWGSIQDIFEGTHRVILVITFGWFAIVNALYGLLFNPPPEIATFRTLEIYEIGSLSRPFHVLFLVLPQIILDYLVENGPFGGIDRYWYGSEPWIGLNYVSHIVLTTMPLLWFLGLFPNVEAFIFWFGEQLQIFTLGGSASYNPVRFGIYLILSVIQFGLFFAFGVLEPESIGNLVTIAGITGYILSLDLVGILDRLLHKIWRSSRVDAHLNSSQHRYHVHRSKTSKKHNNKVPFSKIAHTVKEFFTHVIFLTTTIAILIWYPYQPYQKPAQGEFIEFWGPAFNESKTGNGTTWQLRMNRTFSIHVLVLGWICAGLYLFLKITNEIQKVYAIFGCVRSPCYSSHVASLPNMIWICFRSLIIHFGSPILLSCYVKNLIVEDSILFLDPLPKWLEILALIRIMRWIWQNSEAALIEVGMLNLFLLINYPLAQKSGFIGFFVNELSRVVQLLVFGFLRDRIKQFIEKLYFVISLTVSSLEDRASKRSYAGCLFQLNILFSPFVIAFILISSLISAPLLAFFTLPIFFIAFPRPIKFWPGPIGLQANCSEDSVYYQQMIPALIPSIHRANRAGSLGVLHVGSYLIVRHEDRLVWVQVLEKGNNYFYYGAKGMELQETSCHSLEATRLDDIFLDTFEKEASMNRFLFHTVTPLVNLPVLMYSDTRNVLTGVIESQDTLGLICKTYLQTLVWYLFKWIIKAKHKKSGAIVRHTTQPAVQEEETTTDIVIPLNQFQHPDPVLSESVNDIDLDEWPSSESTIDQVQWAQTTTLNNPALGPRISTPGSTMFDQMSDIVDGDYESGVEDPHGKSLPRNKLLPPINIGHSGSKPIPKADSLESLSKKLDSIYLPGGVLEKTPQAQRREPMAKELTFVSPKQDQRTFKTLMASRLAPDLNWLNLPEFFNMHEEILENNFSREWFVFAFTRTFQPFLKTQGLDDIDQELEDLLVDEELTNMYRKVIKDAFLTVYGSYSGRNVNSLAASGGPALPVNAFGSIFPTSIQLDWIRNEAPSFLEQVILPSIRSAFKLAMDQVLLGYFSSMEELEENLVELDEKWYLGLEDEPEWKKAVSRQVPNLFSVSAIESGGRTARTLYRSHMLSLRECQVNVGRLNPEVVKGLWASLNLELLYLTNDDDERYSIQAEERLLRNLTVQVADPPLGYTIHSSAAIRQGIEPL